MHRNTRRTICRILFVVLCLAPTAAVCATIVYRHTSLYTNAQKERWQDSLFRHLGLIAEIEHVSEPRRGVTLLHDVTLTDPDGRSRVARVRLIELALTAQGLVVVASQPEVDRGQSTRLAEVLHDRVLRGTATQPVKFLAGEVTLHGDENSQTFTSIQCTISEYEHGVEALVDFQVAGVGMNAPAQLRIIRNRQAQPPVTGWHLRTGPVPLPCGLLADYLPSVAGLGRRCRFQGAVWAERTSSGWNGEIAGQFSEADLAAIMKPFRTHKLSGTADIAFSRLLIREGKIDEATGSLSCRGGVISQTLIDSLRTSLSLTGPEGTNQEPLVRYDRLAFGFQIRVSGLSVVGLCERSRGAILMEAGQVLLGPATQEVQTLAVTRALVPDYDLHVPVSRETELLLRALPLPEILRSSSTAQRTYAPLRLRE